MKASKLIAVIAILVLSQMSVAADSLLDFSANMQSFTADFEQTVYDSDSVVLQESSGHVVLQRPGKFRWTYDEPIKQLIVADGLTLWVYDEDILQVTMQPQATTLGSAPIGLLSGERAIESEFSITDLGVKDDLHWYQLEPLVQDTDFNAVYIALDDTGLRAMELRDNFDQATQIRFSNFKQNIEIPSTDLQFIPPAGADVVGEAGVAPDDSDLQAPGDALDNIETPGVVPPEIEDTLLTSPSEPVLEDEDLLKALPESQPLPDDGPPIAETLPLNEIDVDGEITFEETILPTE